MIVICYSVTKNRLFPCRSQTYTANELDIILAIAETGETIEWVDIDPEAFTGARINPHTNTHACNAGRHSRSQTLTDHVCVCMCLAVCHVGY